MRWLVRALILLHRTYGRFPAATRAHTLVRFLSCPFGRVVGAIPRGTRSLLEIGAGHGVFSRLAAEQGVPFVVGVEPDVRKLRRIERVQLVGGFDEAVRGTFDAVALIDVLYTIPLARWDELLRRAHARLAPGGTLIVKEQDPAARLKNAWNALQEWVALRLLRVTMRSAFTYESRDAFTARLQRLGFRDVTSRRIDAGYPHPHVLYVAKR